MIVKTLANGIPLDVSDLKISYIAHVDTHVSM